MNGVFWFGQNARVSPLWFAVSVVVCSSAAAVGTPSFDSGWVVETGSIGSSANDAVCLETDTGVSCVTSSDSGDGFVQVQAEGEDVAQAGSLKYIEAKDNSMSDIGGDVSGLNGVVAVTVSPDGAYVYTVSAVDRAIVTFERLNKDALIFVQSIYAADVQFDGQPLLGEREVPKDVLVSPDGRHLYVVVSDDVTSALAVFLRDADSGVMTLLDKVVLNGVRDVRTAVFTVDGTQVLLGGVDAAGAGFVGLYSRNVDTGEVQLVVDYVSGEPGLERLGLPAAMVISPDGDSVYVAGTAENTVSVFNRQAETGVLEFVEAVGELDTPSSLAISGDGAHVYVAETGRGAVVVLSRDAVTGQLSEIESMVVGGQDSLGQPLDGFDGATGVILSSEDGQLYTWSSTGNSIAVFNRHPQTGRLNYLGVLRQGDGGRVNGLGDVQGIGLSPDGDSLYSAAPQVGEANSAVGVFEVLKTNLTIRLSQPVDAVKQGENVVFDMLVDNVFVEDASGVLVVLPLPETGLAFVSASSDVGGCDYVNNVVRCDLGAIASGGASVNEVVLTPSAKDTYALQAFVYADARDIDLAGNTDTLSLQVGNQKPFAANDEVRTNRDIPLTIEVLANDSDPDGDELIITVFDIDTEAGGVVELGETGYALTYTPPFGYAGPDTFNYTIEDNEGEAATAMVTVEVNSLPDAANDEILTAPGHSVIIHVLANDSDADGDDVSLTDVDVASVEGGEIAPDAGSGSLTYTPPEGFVGVDTFGYSVSDHKGGYAEALVTVFVNTVPQAVDDTFNLSGATSPVILYVLLNDGDIDGHALTIKSVDEKSVAGGSVFNNGDGTLTYTPPTAMASDDTFSYTVADDYRGEATASVIVKFAAAEQSGISPEPNSDDGSGVGSGGSSGGGGATVVGLCLIPYLLLSRIGRRKRFIPTSPARWCGKRFFAPSPPGRRLG